MMRTASLRTIGVAALATAVVALLVASLLAYQDWQRNRALFVEHNDVRLILELNEAVLNGMRDAETGQRGFLLTGRAEYLQPYNAALAQIPGELERISALTVSRPNRANRLRQLQKLVDDKLAELEETIELRRSGRAAEALVVVNSDRGKKTMDLIRGLSAEIEQMENDRWVAAWNGLQNGARQTRVAMLIAGLVLMALVGGGGRALHNAGTQMDRLVAQLNESKRDTEATLGATLYSIGDAVIATDSEGAVRMMNAVAEQLTGYTEKEARLQSVEQIFRIVNENTRARVENPVWRVLREGKAVGLANHTILISRTGQEIPIDDSGAPIVGWSGVVSGVVLVFRDASGRKRAEESARHFAAIVESSADAIFGETLEGIVTSWNRGAERLYGYTAQEMIGKTIRALVPLEQGNELEEIRRRILNGELVDHYETPRLTKDGRRMTISLTASPIRDDRGHVVGLAKIGRDISRERQLEDSVRQSQKMEAVGRLAGGVAHDFNNLLTVILGYGAMLENRLDEGNPLRKMVTQVQLAATRASSLTAQLLAFSRKQVTQPKLLDVNSLILETKELLERLIGEDIDLGFFLEDGECPVKADPGQLTQVIMNLVVNARDAMPTGGKLTIETHTSELQEQSVGQQGIRPAGRYVTLAVTDTGSGMDDMTRALIFEPFFTTKESGKGTGLGLSTVFGVVKQHGGWIDVYSELQHGSTFRIFLPASQRPEDETTPVPEAPISGRTGTILLVEDQAALRMLAVQILSEAGHRVLTAENGQHGLRVAGDFNESIDLLVTDVVMPEMSGPELAIRLSRLRPAMIVLYMSGYTDHALLHGGVLEQGTAFLQKPFLPQALLCKVDELLSAEVVAER
jgi:two-component system cell cycle sensor histidine kinase/response regulator CckA